MPTLSSLFSLASLMLICWVHVCFPVCVEVPSETEAVQGKQMKLRCISCMKREEVTASTVVEWFYRPEGGKDFLIYEFRNGHQEVESPFQGRLQWNGSKDLQDVSLTVLNVTLNDSGIYTCNVSREFEFDSHRPFVKTTRLIPLKVTEEGEIRAQVFPRESLVRQSVGSLLMKSLRNRKEELLQNINSMSAFFSDPLSSFKIELVLRSFPLLLPSFPPTSAKKGEIEEAIWSIPQGLQETGYLLPPNHSHLKASLVFLQKYAEKQHLQLPLVLCCRLQHFF
uniref:Sodium channel regulatory subunit beta-3 n=1 Tax=Monodelphis domestica TaxID=13616 RepID=A0A5F8HKS9_MONDO